MLDCCRGECAVSLMNINNRIKEPTQSKSNIIKTVKQSNALNWENIFIYPSHCLGQYHSLPYWNEEWLYPGIYHDPWKVDKPYLSFRKQKYPQVPIPTGIKKKKKESSLQVPKWGICVKKKETTIRVPLWYLLNLEKVKTENRVLKPGLWGFANYLSWALSSSVPHLQCVLASPFLIYVFQDGSIFFSAGEK